MAKQINWSEDQDATIRQMRAAGFSWDSIALACGVAHRQQIIDRAKALGVPARVSQVDCDDEAEREPLAAGSLTTWGAINAGLSIAGAAYPLPMV